MPIPAEIRGPGDAIGALHRLLKQTTNVYFRPRDLADDLIVLRQKYSEDRAYTAVLVALIKEIPRALRHKEKYGGDNGALSGKLAGVRRNKFPPEDQRAAVLRLLIKPYRDGIHIIAFRHRHDPPGIYGLSAQRLEEILNAH